MYGGDYPGAISPWEPEGARAYVLSDGAAAPTRRQTARGRRPSSRGRRSASNSHRTPSGGNGGILPARSAPRLSTPSGATAYRPSAMERPVRPVPGHQVRRNCQCKKYATRHNPADLMFNPGTIRVSEIVFSWPLLWDGRSGRGGERSVGGVLASNHGRSSR
eukprot:SAG31_NODE_628_length_13432_cov_131.456086_3_plen_162_part_00